MHSCKLPFSTCVLPCNLRFPRCLRLCACVLAAFLPSHRPVITAYVLTSMTGRYIVSPPPHASCPSAYPAPLTKPFAAQALTASNQDQPSSTLPRSPFCLSACPLPPSFAPLLQPPPPPPQLQKAVPPPLPPPCPSPTHPHLSCLTLPHFLPTPTTENVSAPGKIFRRLPALLSHSCCSRGSDVSYRVISDSPAVSAYAPASLLPSFPASSKSFCKISFRILPQACCYLLMRYVLEEYT